jgi:ubiquinone/menaquinone biosynthesis C-methylase UbiE
MMLPGLLRLGQLVLTRAWRDDPVGWFEKVYAGADGDTRLVPWAHHEADAKLVAWLAENGVQGEGKQALVVGCGLGDDAEHLASLGFATTAFDVAPSAVEWARKRHPGSWVTYITADLLDLPEAWQGAFDLVVEAYTLQSLPVGAVRERAVRALAGPVAPGGTLLVICRRREEGEPAGRIPWPLTRSELAPLVLEGLDVASFDVLSEDGDPSRGWFRASYVRP